MQTVDTLLCAVVEGPPTSQPPASPVEGQCFIVASGGSGAWVGKDGNLAAFTDGGWRFIAPSEGLRALDRASGQTLLRRNGGWEAGVIRGQELRIGGQPVVRERQAAVTAPSGGTTVDAECRSAVVALLAALQAHGLIG